jgi:hypothetical protein
MSLVARSPGFTVGVDETRTGDAQHRSRVRRERGTITAHDGDYRYSQTVGLTAGKITRFRDWDPS